ncbi:zinc-dependent peptidase [Pedobacter sp. SD-b]|uniref:Zinc-dependent peptidase n=1 Tax=Pedobacter segetis TaxID=2793069 RepID=A0ABS1BKT3_9SPHI|nr:M90 family metallopeptidase [Pedobacter segetis]MBK0383500.1 zinc-dependent peptidase [Pedobacter segetis]
MLLIICAIFVLLILYFFIKNKLNSGKHPKLNSFDFDKLLQEHVIFYQNLGIEEKTKFKNALNEFLEHTDIEGVGTEITDLDRVLIASSAVIPVFSFAGWRYKNLRNVILYPDTFNGQYQYEGEDRGILGMVGTGYMNGQMLLSRAALVQGFSKNNGKHNTAIHEFVHLLDKSDGSTDGIPEILMAHDYSIPWLKMMHQEMRKIEKGKSDIDSYALTNEAEFLAVVSEYFFEKSGAFEKNHPELYNILSKMFLQDPAKD